MVVLHMRGGQLQYHLCIKDRIISCLHFNNTLLFIETLGGVWFHRYKRDEKPRLFYFKALKLL